MLFPVLFGILFPIAFRPLSLFLARRRAKQMLKENPSYPGLGEQIVEFGEDGIRLTSPTVESRTPWHAIVKAAETKDHLFLYLGPVQAFVVPKRELAAIDITKVIDLVKRCAPNAVVEKASAPA